MKPLIASVLFLGLSVAAVPVVLYHPGGRLNPHVWFADVQHASVIRIDTRGLNEASGVCVEIDFCIRHGESRVLPCQ